MLRKGKENKKNDKVENWVTKLNQSAALIFQKNPGRLNSNSLFTSLGILWPARGQVHFKIDLIDNLKLIKDELTAW